MKKALFFLFLIISCSLMEGQVREIKSTIESDKGGLSSSYSGSSSSSSYSAPDFEDGIAAFLVESFFTILSMVRILD